MEDRASGLGCTGAYGLRIRGAHDPEFLPLSQETCSWPDLTTKIGRPEGHEQQEIGRDVVQLEMLDGDWARCLRQERSASFLTERHAEDGSFVHPFLALAAAAFAWWDGRLAFHGGAVVGRDGAWGLMGDRSSGKSTTLAALVSRGYQVLADDIVVVGDDHVFAGPRCIDLRPDAAEMLGRTLRLRAVRSGSRMRVSLGPAAPITPLCGFIYLGWSDSVRAQALSASQRLRSLLNHLSTTDRHPDVLDLARLPSFQLDRPADLHGLDLSLDSIERLIG
jgi:hypothetical protein